MEHTFQFAGSSESLDYDRTMQTTLKIAVSQFPVSADIAENLEFITRHTIDAAQRGADVIHFPEGALSGYAGTDFKSFHGFDWPALNAALSSVRRLAAEAQIFIIVGAARQVDGEARPRNCIHVVSDGADIVGVYDKRCLYGGEFDLFEAGQQQLVLQINGVRCGFLICNDSNSPSLYQEYASAGVQVLFHSYYNARSSRGPASIDDLALAQLRTRASDNHLWISASNSSARFSRLASGLARPDGSLDQIDRHKSGILVSEAPSVDLGWTIKEGWRQ
jgi:predicted amidohydrolase